MFTQVKTPQDIFFVPQRLLVPLFQRPYVWNEDLQWKPLWEDVKRVADRVLEKGFSAPHFLGAVVLQQQPTEIGTLSVRTVIDGQQRLTTLQLLIDAVHAQVKMRNIDGSAQQALDLVENQKHFRQSPEDAFKVWPTNRDRAAFNEVMSAEVPVDYSKLLNAKSRLVLAHRYFSERIEEWLNEGDAISRSQALVSTVSSLLQVVVIDLLADEDAQEIFETLNARGTALTAADLIKNFVFQRLNVSAEAAERAYHDYWQLFETPFWEEEVSAGRINYTRSSLFLTQWLVAQTKKEITAREVFSRFKIFVTENEKVDDLLPRLNRAAKRYEGLVHESRKATGGISREALFLYRTSTLDSEVAKPLIMWLTDPELPEVPKEQLIKALDTIESWFVRRAIVRASTKAYNRLIVDLLVELDATPRESAGDVVEGFVARQTSSNSYWPTNEEVIRELITQPIYRRIARPRLRMIIEALEDFRRGFTSTVGGRLSESAVPRFSTSIEHVMPQEWRSSWPGDEYNEDGKSRDSLVHMIGNLTLLTQALNSKASNAPWGTKREHFSEHSTLLLTADILKSDEWDQLEILERSEKLARQICEIWPVSTRNIGLQEDEPRSNSTKVSVLDLVTVGYLQPGQPLYARTQAHLGREAFVSEDGGLFVDGLREETPSGAARKVTGSSAEQGWWFWLTDVESRTCLADLRKQYIDSMALDAADDETFDRDENVMSGA
jgi:hypothetical protein